MNRPLPTFKVALPERSRRQNRHDPPVRFQSGNSRDFPVNAGKHRRSPIARKPTFCTTFLGRSGSYVLLAMQKVEGSNPFSRFREGLRLQVFFVGAVGWCVCVVPDRNRTRGRSTIRLARRKRLFAGSSSSFELLTSCGGDAEGHEFDSPASPVQSGLGR